MNKKKEIKTRYFADDPRFRFLSEKDRYILSEQQPKYRFNVIGTGTIGQEHIYVTTLEGRAVIHGIYDPHPPSIETAKREYAKYSGNELKVYDSLEQACDDPEVDALLICTPNYTHLEVVKTAVKSGKHILLEKPMATTIADAHEITKIADGYDAVFQIGLQYRYKSIYVEAIHEALTRQSLGEIKTVSMQEHRPPFLDKVGQWNKFSRYSGGSLVEKCCHYFDLINLFAQSRPVNVYAIGSMAVNFKDFEYDNERSDIVDNAFVSIIYENELRAGFDLNMFSPVFYEELVLCGDEGRLKAHEKFDFFHKSGSESLLEISHGENRASRTVIPEYPTVIERSGHYGSTFYEHQMFVNNIDGKETSSAKVHEGFWSVAVGVAAEESLKTGNVVSVEELLNKQKIDLDSIS